MIMFLAIDPSTTALGWATNKYEGDEGYGVIRADQKLREHRLCSVMEDLSLLMEEVRPGVVSFYIPFARGDAATRAAFGVTGIIEALAPHHGAAVLDVAEATVRKHFAITPPKGLVKTEKRNWLKSMALTRAAELCQYTGSIDDEAEALLLLAYTREKATVA